MVDNIFSSTISVLIRFHDENALHFLDKSLFSISIQNYKNVQVVISVQAGYPELIEKIAQLILKQPFANLPVEDSLVCEKEDFSYRKIGSHIIVSTAVKSSKDIRSQLINKAFAVAEGRFLAFLDYDDVVYPNAYLSLINRIYSTNCSIAVGGCIESIIDIQNKREHVYYTINKKPFKLPPSFTRINIVAGQAIPIHSYVIDRNAVEEKDLYFDENLSNHEDFLFILSLACKYDFDFKLLSTPICEYHIRNDGTNTINVFSFNNDKQTLWTYASVYVNKAKEKLQTNFNAAEISEAMIHRVDLTTTTDEYNSLSVLIALRIRKIISNYPKLKVILYKFLSCVFK